MSDKKTDLFNNQMVDSALKALTPEQLENYEKWGKYMFKTDFEKINGPNPEKEMKDAIFYIKEGLKSGVHPEDLTKKELQIMYEVYGNKWYEEYGYYEDEVPPNPDLNVGLGTVANPSDQLTPAQIQEEIERRKQEKIMEKKKKEKKERRRNGNRTAKHKH